MQREAILRSKVEAQNLKMRLDTAEQRIKEARHANQVAQPPPDKIAKQFLLQLAFSTAKDNPRFVQLFEGRDIDIQLAFTIHRALTDDLADLFPISETICTLNDVLVRVREMQLLNDDQLDLAHFIRRQRNVIAHEELSRDSALARTLLIFLAAALLWPELPQRKRKETQPKLADEHPNPLRL